MSIILLHRHTMLINVLNKISLFMSDTICLPVRCDLTLLCLHTRKYLRTIQLAGACCNFLPTAEQILDFCSTVGFKLLRLLVFRTENTAS